ncbi:MAG TPA: hypothetical protein VEK39_05655 [Solirubrobacterales bacterium]|nr:hypothetical protein [Solirubrobacterales bacterium]
MQHPVERVEQSERSGPPTAVADRAEQVEADHDRVAQHEVEQRDRPEDAGVDERQVGLAERVPARGSEPQRRRQQEGERRAADQQQEPERVGHPHLTHEPARRSRVDQGGLHVSLDPAGSLANPRPDPRARLLVGRGVDHADAVALDRCTQAEVGVLGHVVRVPSAQPAQRIHAEVIRGSAERDRKPEAVEAGKHDPEPVAVLEGEHAREEVGAAVPVAQASLHAHGLLVGVAEGGDGLAQLVGIRPVLGVVDDQELAPGQEEPDVAGPGLGLGLRLGNHHQPYVRRRPRCLGGGDRLRVVLLEQDEDLELLLGVVDRGEVVDQVPDDVRLAIDRDQDRVDRQASIVKLAPGPSTQALTESRQARDELEHHGGEEAEVREHDERRQGESPVEHRADGRRDQGCGHHRLLAPRPSAGRGKVGAVVQQLDGRALYEVFTEAIHDRALDVERRGGVKLDRGIGAELAANRRQQLTARRLACRDDHPVVGVAHRNPSLGEQALGVAPADELCVDPGREQVDEGKPPLPAEHALEVEPVDLPRRQQDPAQALAGLTLALQGPIEGLLVDQAVVDEGGADRDDGADRLRVARGALDG